MKEIVIKIPDNMLNVIKNSENTTWLAVTYGNQLVWQVKNGTELPKGHGELIDARAFLQSINNSDYDTYNDYSNTFDWIEDAETLVEADKGEEI